MLELCADEVAAGGSDAADGVRGVVGGGEREREGGGGCCGCCIT